MLDKAKILDAESLERTLLRIAHEILEKNKGTQEMCIVGIRTRGAILAQRLNQCIANIEGQMLPMGVLDITLYRDDLTLVAASPVVHQTEIPFDITGKRVILVDDVLYTGRTIRAAMDALMDFGRPQNIQLVVLVDRGHREMPIRADFAGKNIPTAQNEAVEVRLKEIDGKEEVVIIEK
ncbi:MAG: bifunctional pyr operon transcriptional regulator/uracil phosphoribosyltransferase PyrR [Candidatus Omnitrophota bacterium]